jgi:hypothetical protein
VNTLGIRVIANLAIKLIRHRSTIALLTTYGICHGQLYQMLITTQFPGGAGWKLQITSTLAVK